MRNLFRHRFFQTLLPVYSRQQSRNILSPYRAHWSSSENGKEFFGFFSFIYIRREERRVVVSCVCLYLTCRTHVSRLSSVVKLFRWCQQKKFFGKIKFHLPGSEMFESNTSAVATFHLFDCRWGSLRYRAVNEGIGKVFLGKRKHIKPPSLGKNENKWNYGNDMKLCCLSVDALSHLHKQVEQKFSQHFYCLMKKCQARMLFRHIFW